MRKYCFFFVTAAFFVSGVFLSVATSRHYFLLDEFPRVMALRFVITETFKTLPASVELRLLDMYEDDIRRQSGWFGTSRFNWNEEKIAVALQQYVLHAGEGRTEFANEALLRAGKLRKNTTPTTQDIEFERQLALRLFPRSDSSRQ
jgi:hypothetical protein